MWTVATGQWAVDIGLCGLCGLLLECSGSRGACAAFLFLFFLLCAIKTPDPSATYGVSQLGKTPSISTIERQSVRWYPVDPKADQYSTYARLLAVSSQQPPIFLYLLRNPFWPGGPMVEVGAVPENTVPVPYFATHHGVWPSPVTAIRDTNTTLS